MIWYQYHIIHESRVTDADKLALNRCVVSATITRITQHIWEFQIPCHDLERNCADIILFTTPTETNQRSILDGHDLESYVHYETWAMFPTLMLLLPLLTNLETQTDWLLHNITCKYLLWLEERGCWIQMMMFTGHSFVVANLGRWPDSHGSSVLTVENS